MKLYRISFFIACVVFISSIEVWAITFQPVISLPAGVSPRGLTVGDALGDGNQELVIANFGYSTFIGQSTPQTLLNLANSSLQIYSPSPDGLKLTATLPSAASPRGVCLFNFGSINSSSLFVSAYDADLLQVYEKADGSLKRVEEAPTLKMPVGVAAAYGCTGGCPFVAVADYGSNSISLFPFKNGRLGTRIDIPVDSGPTQLAIGDLNGSGVNSIAVACLPSSKIDILTMHPMGQGSDLSTYSITQTLSLPEGSAPADLRIADLNQDRKQDLVVADFAKNTVYIYLQQKDGSLQAQTPLLTSGSHPNGLTVADLYGDGKKEIIVANRDSDSIDIFQILGSQFQLTQTLKVSQDSNSSFGPIELGVLDTRGSGLKDIVASHMRSNTLKVFNQNLAAGFTSVTASTYVAENRTPFSENTTFCFPNPTHNENVKFSFNLDIPSAVSIQVFDMQGEKVWSQYLNAGQTQSGVNLVAWNGTNQQRLHLASGLYLYRISTGTQTVTKKLAIVR